MKVKILTLVLLFAGVTLFAQDDWKTLKKDDYAISYPKDWVSSDQKPQPNMQFLLLSEEKSQRDDLFRENINLITENLGGRDLTLQAYTKLSIDQIIAQIPSARILSHESAKVEGREAAAIVWSADFGNDMILKFKQIILVYNDKGYVLTFSSSEAEYDSYVQIGSRILNSFKLAK
ncbi:PsbP-related protein [Winogradskyella sp.]|uniref:PsbP-related protein n=1 Tax=Winogradskyella sp. TaxID=1883156 RepID=UPI003BAB51DA